jgi:CPA2 family monovalent cation:H+ antiporter-2
MVLENPIDIVALVLGVILLKSAVLFVTGKLARLSFDQNMIFSLGLGQIGEFAFVLFAFIAQLQILSDPWSDLMMGATAISMAVTPLFLLINERFILPKFGTKEMVKRRDADDIEGGNSVIIAGFGHFGSTVGRFLRANGVSATILDNDSDRVELLRKMGFTVFYGDATRMDILKSAGAETAKILIAAIDSPDINFDLVEKTKKAFPGLRILVRAKSRIDAYDLMDMGISDIYRESLDTSVRLGVDALVMLGFRRYTALRAGQNFLRYDEEALKRLAVHRHDQQRYLFQLREEIDIQEQLLAEDRKVIPHLQDASWDRGNNEE